jgi:polyisoprenoid-binding protein YceI
MPGHTYIEQKFANSRQSIPHCRREALMSCTRISCIFLLVLIVTALSSSTYCQAPHSSFTIHLGKTGLFSAVGHNHVVVAPIAHGSIDAKAMAVEITVVTAQMKVTDSDVSEKDRAEIESTMLGPKVLDAARFPEIRFNSSRVEQTSPGHIRVMGTLMLHGVSKELVFEVTGDTMHYQGKTKIKQTAFGIKPVTVGGGTVKVKDEVEIDFDVYPADLNGSKR